MSGQGDLFAPEPKPFESPAAVPLAGPQEPPRASDEQISAALGMNPSTARPRRIELVRAGLVREVGTVQSAARRRAHLWGVIPEDER